MQVCCLSTLDELAPYAEQWDALADGVPFRSWAWASTWWKHYGQPDYSDPESNRLAVVCVFDHTDSLVGVAPWYLDHSLTQGRVLRNLGGGEVCSDYVSILCRHDVESQVVEAISHWLISGDHSETASSNSAEALPWDLLELDGCDFEDRPTSLLLRDLADSGESFHRRPSPSCWRIDLPASWEDYLMTLSKSHRKQLRRFQKRIIDQGRAVLHTVETMDQLERGVEILVDLHQRRRRSLGESGRFVSKQFDAFHREVMPQLLRTGQLHLHWLELDGKPAAAEYQLAGGGIVYAYQSGVDPDVLDAEPGTLITMLTLQRAIEHGYRAVDFLRGDEPYKPHWRASPRPQTAIRVVPNRTAARLRHGIWLAGSNVKRLVKAAAGR